MMEYLTVALVAVIGLGIIFYDIHKWPIMLIGLISIYYHEAVLGRDIAICVECGDVADVPIDECPECGGEMDEVMHYPPDDDEEVLG